MTTRASVTPRGSSKRKPQHPLVPELPCPEAYGRRRGSSISGILPTPYDASRSADSSPIGSPTDAARRKSRRSRSSTLMSHVGNSSPRGAISLSLSPATLINTPMAAMKMLSPRGSRSLRRKTSAGSLAGATAESPGRSGLSRSRQNSSVSLDTAYPLSPRVFMKEASSSLSSLPDVLDGINSAADIPEIVDDAVVLPYAADGDRVTDLHTKWRKPTCQGEIPQPRTHHSSVVLGDRMFVIGGTDGDSVKNQVFVLNLTTLTWSKPKTNGTPPAHRYGHSCTVIGKQLYIYGGKGKHGVFDDLFTLDTETMTWYSLPSSGNKGRVNHCAWYYGGYLYIYGGRLPNSLSANTLLRFAVVPRLWVELAVEKLRGRILATISDLGEGQVAIVGGFTSTKPVVGGVCVLSVRSPILIIDGPNLTFKRVKMSKGLALAGSASAVYGRSLVIFGGLYKNEQPVSDVLVLDLPTGQWQKHSPSTIEGRPLPTLFGHSAVTWKKNIFIFGGKGTNAITNEFHWLQVGSSVASDVEAKFSDLRSSLNDRAQVNWVPLSEVTRGDTLATGGSGVVFKVEWQGRPAVLKQYFIRDVEAFEKEVAVLTSLKHRNLVSFLGATKAEKENATPAVLLEHVPMGDLSHVLQQLKEPLKWMQVLRLAREVAEGMAFLHSRNVIHRDLKSSNLLVASLDVDAEVMAKLMDFGDAQELTHKQRDASDGLAGTTRWSAPELLEDKSVSCTTKSDVYSFGIILWELVSREVPFGDIRYNYEVAIAVVAGKRPKIPEGTLMGLSQLMTACWSASPADRLSFEDIVRILRNLEARQARGTDDEDVYRYSDEEDARGVPIRAEVRLSDVLEAMASPCRDHRRRSRLRSGDRRPSKEKVSECVWRKAGKSLSSPKLSQGDRLLTSPRPSAASSSDSPIHSRRNGWKKASVGSVYSSSSSDLAFLEDEGSHQEALFSMDDE